MKVGVFVPKIPGFVCCQTLYPVDLWFCTRCHSPRPPEADLAVARERVAGAQRRRANRNKEAA